MGPAGRSKKGKVKEEEVASVGQAALVGAGRQATSNPSLKQVT